MYCHIWLKKYIWKLNIDIYFFKCWRTNPWAIWDSISTHNGFWSYCNNGWEHFGGARSYSTHCNNGLHILCGITLFLHRRVTIKMDLAEIVQWSKRERPFKNWAGQALIFLMLSYKILVYLLLRQSNI